MHMLQFAVVSIPLASIMAGHTLDFYQDTRTRPILVYECYRTGVTAEPQDAVNFTSLFDCTVASGDQKCEAVTWTAESGSPESYQKNILEYDYDEASDSLVVSSSDFTERISMPIRPHNGMAYYFKMTITTDEDREVYKLYDVESTCGNAALLLSQLDLEGRGNFVFSRAVVEPTQSCKRSLKCA
ncbi:uncharacterized protein LOC119404172 [Rhipicephalus sanguineus]|uniref:uncharacterized protein LOC119404172 n=1 Tax=Rhipicephalus sanguineus TaxID=34632 RepID=UPI0020C47958|nr:uncharacterized protein LOC119404172 [Rhipicephalus sanguineus]